MAGKVWHGSVGHGEVRQGEAGHDMAWLAGQGRARPGLAWHGMAGGAWQGMDRQGQAWYGRQGMAAPDREGVPMKRRRWVDCVRDVWTVNVLTRTGGIAENGSVQVAIPCGSTETDAILAACDDQGWHTELEMEALMDESDVQMQEEMYLEVDLDDDTP